MKFLTPNPVVQTDGSFQMEGHGTIGDSTMSLPRTSGSMPPLEVWGGIECTVGRIRDHVRNQIHETGHFERDDDLDRIASIGLRTLRYPLLWETIAPDHPGQCEWGWHDRRLQR